MSRLLVATRKGLLTFEDGSGGWALTETAFPGEPVTSVLSDRRDGAVYAALNLGHFGVKLHRSDDGGANWTELQAPAFPPAPEGEEALSVAQLWSLAAGLADQNGLIWCGTIPGGLFRSDDRGETWRLVDSLWNEPLRGEWFGGGADAPGIHSICVDPRDGRRIAIGVSCGGVWLSGDGGESWRLGGNGLKAAYMPPDRVDDPSIQDPHSLAQCAAAPEVIWCQHHNGIFLSEDGGDTFTTIETARPSAFGFAVVVHPDDPDRAWFAPAVKDECRIPVDNRFVVSRTSDRGKSFEIFSEGLPPAPSFDLVYRHGLDIDPAGDRLAMGSTTGSLWVGEDGGTRWSLLSAHLPPVNQVRWS